MKTSVERIDDVTVKLRVEVEASRVDEAIAHAVSHLGQDVKVPGFRPGRVPRKVLENRFGKGAIRAHAMQEALPEYYTEALREADLPVVGDPEFDVETFEDGQDAVFTATVEVRPEVAVPEYEGLQVPHPEWEATDEEVDRQLEALREKFAELETVDRPAGAGDFALITITGERHGQRVEEASGEDVLYEVGDADETDSALDRNLAGASAGAILKFTDTLGKDYGDLADAEVAFTVLVKEVKTRRLPALDDDFALTASEFDTIDELRAEITTQLGRQKLAYSLSALRGAVVEAVTDLVEVPLPPSMVQSEVQYRLSQVARDAERHGLSLEQYFDALGEDADRLVPQITEEAQRTVKAQLVIDAIGRAAEIDVTREDLGAEVARQAMRLGRPAEELARLMTQPENLPALVGDAFRRKTIDHLIDKVQVLSGPPQEVIDRLEAEYAAMEAEDEAAAAGGAVEADDAARADDGTDEAAAGTTGAEGEDA